MRETTRQLLAGLVLLWAMSASAVELYRSAWLWRADPWSAERPSTWRITSARVGELRHTLEPLQDATGGRLVVIPQHGQEGVFLALWTRYLLPRFEVSADRGDLPAADFLLTGPGVASPARPSESLHRAETIGSSAVGTLYRLHPAAATGD